MIVKSRRTRLRAREVESLDPYQLFAYLGKRVIHPGGRRATQQLLELAALRPGMEVLDIGCGVGTTAIQVASRLGVRVTAADISPLMLELTRTAVERARAGHLVEVAEADLTALAYPSGRFDRVFAEAVTMFVDRPTAAAELVRVCRAGGMVLATEFLWRRPPVPEARAAFLGEVCPGMTFDTLEDWLSIYRRAGLVDLETRSGPFEMMTTRGFLEDEGILNGARVAGRTLSQRACLRRMAWLMPRIAKAVPYLGYLVVAGRRPAAEEVPIDG
jgi:SAM-dependent methyltransferase